MRIFFSVEDWQGWKRTLHVRAALLKRGHRVVPRTPVTRRPPRGTELWLHGMSWDPKTALHDDVAPELVRFGGPIALFQTDDDLRIFAERIPEDVKALTRVYLRNQWESDLSKLAPEVQRSKGYLLPLLPHNRPLHPGAPLASRRRVAMFYGAGTGSPWNGTVGAREKTVRLLRGSGLAFEGGIVEATQGDYERAEDISVARISPDAHTRALRSARICVAPWGNNPMTYRFFEGLSARCLVVAQSLRGVDYLDMGIEPGVHFVEVRADLADLVEKVGYYLEHDEEAQRIADAGHEHYARHFTWRRLDVPDSLVDAMFASWGGVLTPVARPSLASRLIRRALPVLPYV